MWYAPTHLLNAKMRTVQVIKARKMLFTNQMLKTISFCVDLKLKKLKISTYTKLSPISIIWQFLPSLDSISKYFLSQLEI